MQIDGPKQGKLRAFILNTFELNDFSDFLSDRFSLSIGHIAPPAANFTVQVGAVIKYFNNREWIPKLLSALIAERSEAEGFQKLSYEWGLHPSIYQNDPGQPLNANSLEVLVNSEPFLDINVFIKGLTDKKRCVCRVAVPLKNGDTTAGTGFLVKEDLILTNYHVLQPVIEHPELSSKVICKFDFEFDEKGNTINNGLDYSLATNNPILAFSPMCPFDINGTETVNVDWPDNHFDYVLARLSEKVGAMPYGVNADKSTSEKATTRGWIKVSDTDAKLNKGANVIILQHPEAKPMKVALGFGKIIGADDKERRVRYQLNTLKGSSGSPCFDEKFNWIALHNMGEDKFNDKFNQGIPAKRIVEDLIAKQIQL
jgi:hypothetical protein